MDLHYLSLREIGRRIRQRSISSDEVVRSLLDRIQRYDSRLNSFISVTADTALAEARHCDRELARGLYRGPLHGVPIGLKDLLFVKEAVTTSGTAAMREWRPAYDATVVHRLRQAGAVLIGKLHMTEAASFEHHPAFPAPVNPWSPSLWPGASSSGSGIATAAGFCFGALGSDTGGSIGMPSAACGLSGIKPTWGRVSRYGVFPLAESFDHIGPLARSAEDAAIILQAIAGADDNDPTALTDAVPDYMDALGRGVNGLTIGVDWKYITKDVSAEVIEAIEAAVAVMRDRGARIREVTLPATRTINDDVGALMMSEFLMAHEAMFARERDKYGKWLAGTLQIASTVRGVDVARANIARLTFREQMRAAFSGIDLMLIPTLFRSGLAWDDIDAMAADMPSLGWTLMRFTVPFNIAGNPTITLPCGFHKEAPISLQFVAAHLREDLLCRAGHAFQSVTDHHLHHPDLVD